MSLSERLRLIFNRRMAYRRVFFGDDDQLTEDAKVVIADLMRFCRLYQSTTIISRLTAQTDVPGSFQAEGRREVALRILAHLRRDDTDIFDVTEERAKDE